MGADADTKRGTGRDANPNANPNATLDANGGAKRSAGADAGPRAWKLGAGRLVSAVALVFCVPLGALFVSVATGAVGIFFGITGYALGARRLGGAAVALCTIAMFVGLLVGPGVVPGDFYDRAVEGWFRNMPTERFTED